eukprot:SAG31_NODE_1260_length_9073_cov_2.761088_1_plen_86_part_00
MSQQRTFRGHAAAPVVPDWESAIDKQQVLAVSGEVPPQTKFKEFDSERHPKAHARPPARPPRESPCCSRHDDDQIPCEKNIFLCV